MGQSLLGCAPKAFGAATESGEGGKKVRCRTGIISQEPEYLSGPPHSWLQGATAWAAVDLPHDGWEAVTP